MPLYQPSTLEVGGGGWQRLAGGRIVAEDGGKRSMEDRDADQERRQNGQPHRLVGLVASLPAARALRLCADRGGLVERIPSPLRSPATWGNGGPHSAEPSIADKTAMAGGRHEG
jgi:hypothetical protein